MEVDVDRRHANHRRAKASFSAEGEYGGCSSPAGGGRVERMRGWRAVGMQAPHPRVFSAWRAPSSYVTHAHAFQEDQTTYAPLLCSCYLLCLCDHFLLCSLADSGSPILLFPASPTLSIQLISAFFVCPLLKITALSAEIEQFLLLEPFVVS